MSNKNILTPERLAEIKALIKIAAENEQKRQQKQGESLDFYALKKDTLNNLGLFEGLMGFTDSHDKMYFILDTAFEAYIESNSQYAGRASEAFSAYCIFKDLFITVNRYKDFIEAQYLKYYELNGDLAKNPINDDDYDPGKF